MMSMTYDVWLELAARSVSTAAELLIEPGLPDWY
jgi:hypothetical protein